jgi:CheY-like chemotaxis protein
MPVLAPPHLRPTESGKDRMRVLLIEDDSATARSIELMLRSEGLNVYTTGLGGEGVDLSKLYDYDIIVLDLSLPDMSGSSERLLADCYTVANGLGLRQNIVQVPIIRIDHDGDRACL